jgi:thiamine-monophosphate kinase
LNIFSAVCLKEFDLIQLLTRSLPSNPNVITGPGDDCAVLDLGLPDDYILFKTDAVVEGVHFTSATPPDKIGRKALGRVLSDIAAMGGTPSAALVTLGLPPHYQVPMVEAVYQGLNALATEWKTSVVGGETTTNPGGMLLSIALLGTVAKTRCIHRSGAKPGDAIFVTGQLGGSIAGKHLDFEPRISEGLWLAKHFEIHAMIDLSDGLGGDLKHILRASGVGAELSTAAIPISREAKLQAKMESSAKPPLLAALTDGEDFELLFTIASRLAVPLLDGWKAQFPNQKLSCIGRITETPGLRLRDHNGVREFNAMGYQHFSVPARS